MLNVLYIGEDEGLFGIEPKGNDLLDVALSHLNRLVQRQLWPVQVLFIISDLDDARNVEHLLQPLSHDEGNRVSHMKRLRRRSPAGVQVEGDSLLVGVEDLVQLPVAEEDASADQSVHGSANDTLHPLNQLLGQRSATKLLHQLVVVYARVCHGVDFQTSDDVLALCEFNYYFFLGFLSGRI